MVCNPILYMPMGYRACTPFGRLRAEGVPKGARTGRAIHCGSICALVRDACSGPPAGEYSGRPAKSWFVTYFYIYRWVTELARHSAGSGQRAGGGQVDERIAGGGGGGEILIEGWAGLLVVVR